MPNGARLEAHSGMGSLMDDPRYIGERDVGPTPPNVYDLKPRERPFHGVKALRMIPQDESATLGRDGLLTHSYLLGPNGDSNGRVSFKNYDKFLTAFQNGEVKRLVVVTASAQAVSASRKPTRSPETRAARDSPPAWPVRHHTSRYLPPPRTAMR